MSYDSVRDYLTKGIITPVNNRLVASKVPFTLMELEPFGPKVCIDSSKRKGSNNWALDLLVNVKTLAALKISVNDLPASNFFWKNNNVIAAVTSSTPADAQKWYQISCDQSNLKIYVDIPTALPHSKAENRFQMFYVYADNLETRFVGNNQYRLLTTIPEPGPRIRTGKTSFTYRPPYPIYFPMESRIHKQINIEIKDDNDKAIYFEWGVTQFLVHIRTVRDV